jgi:nucleotide-binding universal stress UspA family protein
MADSSPVERTYGRILAWVDLDQGGGEPVARRALHLARITGAKLVLFHAIRPEHNASDGYPAPSRASLKQSYETAAQARLRQIANWVGAGDAECHAIYGPSPAQSFAAYAAQWAPDLVVARADATGDVAEGRWDVLSVQSAARSRRGHLARLFEWVLA